MEVIWQGILQAFRLLLAGDPEVWNITILTLKVSGTATLLSLIVGIPSGALLALARLPGRKFTMSLVNTGMGLPPTVAGLWVTILLWRYGPLGFFHLLYTPSAMIVAQFVIAVPIVIGISAAAFQQVDGKLRLQIMALGASRWQTVLLLVREVRLPLLAAVMAGFGGVISEVGASMMVGGNVMGRTRVLTTAIVMEVSKGNYDVAIALGIILMILTYGITLALTLLQQRRNQP